MSKTNTPITPVEMPGMQQIGTYIDKNGERQAKHATIGAVKLFFKSGTSQDLIDAFTAALSNGIVELKADYSPATYQAQEFIYNSKVKGNWQSVLSKAVYPIKFFAKGIVGAQEKQTPAPVQTEVNVEELLNHG